MRDSTKIILIDEWQKERPLRTFWEDADFRVFMFHDGRGVLPSLAETGVFSASTLLVLSSASYQTGEHLRQLTGLLEAVEQKAEGGFRRDRNVIVLTNSRQEFISTKEALPDVQIEHVNNTCFLRPADFQVGTGNYQFDAVLNSKPAPFKRHHLSALVRNKAFITYGAEHIAKSDNAEAVDLAAFSPEKIFWNIKTPQVADVLSVSRVGLILSEQEGACYASTEYLLAGLPVVSTASRGGRDDFYHAHNAVIVTDTPAAVRDAVVHLKSELEIDKIDREDIRSGAIKTMQMFRERFAVALEMGLRTLGASSPSMARVIEERVNSSSKLLDSRNFWIKAVAKSNRS